MSIIEKLKLSKYHNLVVLNKPEDYIIFDNFATELIKNHDAIFIFIETIEEMVKHTIKVIEGNELLQEKGYLFFAYPKKGNKRYDTHVHRDEIFPALKVDEDGYVYDSDIKFARMVSMDDVFTVVGLKREKKKEKKTSPSSQSVADYEVNVKDVEAMLIDHPSEFSFYQSLTPGYRRDWARFIFSAKQQKTRDKRVEQMVEVLSQGYKTIDLFRQNKK
ncbi:YdeI/OmpD-associated family protein [Ornithinibacillus massiliensis]|uniref:YdeI/OmpD-associated family protein n=1 Tax=Ornithinibacillus massiliensis TaxID=1944633 RepID=A0ABS5M9N8_9BACI|nr:YdeI/OmpD-associated family protein [Ornithinibacillus massiliensis]MBS3679031.1 YdeI/OmpD-associated family protein [Ornithinibacillus massiliensis]